MTIADWIQVNSEWIALAVSILVLVGLGYYIVKRRRLGVLAIFLMVWGLLFFYYIINIAGLSRSNQLPPADWAQIWGQILLLGGLLVVTAAYAYSTEKMAEEMREQRYDALRPVIDFKWRDYSDANVNKIAWIAGMDGKVPTELSCKLRNVGFGPAIELYSFKIVGQDNRNHRDFGTLKVGGETDDWVALSVSQEGNGGVLEACYKDIHDNTCKSILEVYPVKGEGLRSKLRVEKCRSKPK